MVVSVQEEARMGHVASGHLIREICFGSYPSPGVGNGSRYIHANIRPVAGSDFCVAQIDHVSVQILCRESDSVRAARIASLIKELLGTLRVIPLVLLELFWPLFKWGVTPLDANPPRVFPV